MSANSAKSRGNLVADLIAGITTGIAKGRINRDCGRSNQRDTRPADGHEQAQRHARADQHGCADSYHSADRHVRSRTGRRSRSESHRDHRG